MSKNSAPPKWVMDYAAKCKLALGIEAWDVRVTLTEGLSFEGEPAKGTHTSNWRTISSEVELHPDIKNTGKSDDAYSSITHEFLHIALMGFWVAHENAMDFVPKKHRAHCRKLFVNEQERIVESLARSLTPVLKAVQERP